METKNTSQSSRKDILQWLKESKEAAAGLITRAETICTDLFSTGDLSGFLALLIRLHQYDYRNLLLIYDQFPDATILAPYKVWQNMLPSDKAQVLKNDWKGRGIELLAPFTEARGNAQALVWHSVKQFDITQTTIDPATLPQPSSPYISDEKHINFLLSATQAVLSYLFKKSLLMVTSTNPALPEHMPFRLTTESVVFRIDTGPMARLQITTEALARYAAMAAIPQEQHTLFSICVCHCLFELWGLPDINPAPVPGAQISSIPASVQPKFLELLQRTVRLIDETTTCAYLALREDERTDANDENIASILDLA